MLNDKTYKIEVLCNPENGKYFYCILECGKHGWFNTGICGWEDSIQEAFNVAYKNGKRFKNIGF